MHIPVLQKEVLQYLTPKPNEHFIDATCDGGGHASAILEMTQPRGKVLGIDRDPEILKNIKAKKHLTLVCGNFASLEEIVRKNKFIKVKGILFDLGMSSWHLEKSGRGFSFKRNEPLDMRYNIQDQLTAEKIINYWSKFELEKILREYGEEKFSAEIAKEIVEGRGRPIKNTLQLVAIIEKAVPRSYQRQKIHFATRTFQALRVAVNDELNNLKKGLPQALNVLESGGRLVVISFHSLEDRIVKNLFREWAREGLPAPDRPWEIGPGPKVKILTKKPVTASAQEVKINPRARSAKLRAVIKL